MKSYAVICTDLHSAVGPFFDLKTAIATARKLSNDPVDTCQYITVPFTFLGEVLTKKQESEVDSTWSPGQYL